MNERRQSNRHKSFLRGCVYFNNRRSAFDCLIRDISDQGARLIFSDTVSVPDLVDLYIPQKEQTLPARVEWRQALEVGVAFVQAGRAPASPLPSDFAELSHRVHKLETDIASLRRILKRLKADISGDADPEAA